MWYFRFHGPEARHPQSNNSTQPTPYHASVIEISRNAPLGLAFKAAVMEKAAVNPPSVSANG